MAFAHRYVAGVVLAMVTVVGSARAAEAAPDDPAPATSQNETDAEAALARGVELRRQRSDAEALAEFRRAYALAPTPRALAQIALAEGALERWVAGEADLVQALATDDPWVERQRSVLQVALKEIQKHLGTLDVSGTDGAEILLDGEVIGRVPKASLRVPARHVALDVRAAGFVTKHVEVDVGAGDTERITVVLEVAPVEPAHEAPPIDAPPSPLRARLAWGTGIAGAVLLAAGVGFNLYAADRGAQYNDDLLCNKPGGPKRSEQCPGLASEYTTGKTLMITGYALGGAAAATSAILFLTQPRAASAKVGASCGPWVGGVVCSGRF
jgi:hypothetical protein